MSKRRKLSHAQRMRQRQLRRLEGGPSQDAQEIYAEAFQWAAEQPEAALVVGAMTRQDVIERVVGVANREALGFPDDEVRTVVLLLQYWHILNGFTFFFDWWLTPIAEMSIEEIVTQIDQDHADGKIPRLIQENPPTP